MLGSRPISVHIDQPTVGGVPTGFKTPGRGLLQNRGENATSRKFVSQTPFKQTFAQNTTTPHLGKAGGSQAVEKTLQRTVLRQTLGDKTPFPNRTKNRSSGGSQEPLGFAPIGLDKPTSLDTPGLRPSSSRKSVRRSSRGSGGFNLTGLQGLDFSTFQTPRVNGNPWDVEDIDVLAAPTEKTIQEEPVEDYDEIEYMPPKVEELPWSPPIDLPDYKELGHLLVNFSKQTWDDDDMLQPKWDNDSYEIPSTSFPIMLELPEQAPLHFVTPPPSPAPASKPSTVRAPLQGPINRTRSATVSVKAAPAPARRTVTQPPSKTPAASLSRMSARNLAVPTVASTSKPSPTDSATRPLTRSRSALDVLCKPAPFTTTPSRRPAAKADSATTTTTSRREPATSRSATTSRTSSARPSPPTTRASSTTLPKRPATVASVRPPIPTKFKAATPTRTTSVPVALFKPKDELSEEFDQLVKEKGLDEMDDFTFTLDDEEVTE